MMSEQGIALPERNDFPSRQRNEPKNVSSFIYGAGRVIYLPELEKPEGEIRLGYEDRSGLCQDMPMSSNLLFTGAGPRQETSAYRLQRLNGSVSHDGYTTEKP